MIRQIKWYLKQLLPLSYVSNYSDGNGVKHHTHWKMWFGRCYKIQDFTP